MASRAQRRWLDAELPRLVEAGVVPAEVAAAIREHYAAAHRGAGAIPLFAVLGAGLIGLGVILLVAANWEDLGRSARAGLTFAMLLTAQAFAAFVLLRQRTSAAWTEAGALILALANAAAIALISQTYQIQGDLRGFLTTWLFLILPLPYLFDSRAVAALVLFGAWGWLASSLEPGTSTRLFWIFVVALLPYLAALSRHPDAPLRNAFAATIAVPVIAFGAVTSFHVESANGLALLCAGVAAGAFALGAAPARDGAYYAAPASVLAGLALLGATLALGFEDAWGWVGDDVERRGEPPLFDTVAAVIVGVAFAALALRGALRLLRAGDWSRALLAGFPLLVATGIVVVESSETRLAASTLANLYGLAVAVGMSLYGLERADLRRANVGLLFLAILVFFRFSDWNLSFTLRGIVFIGFGIAFLLLNLHLRRRRLAGAP